MVEPLRKMSKQRLFLGIDGGTESIRAGLFTENGVLRISLLLCHSQLETI